MNPEQQRLHALEIDKLATELEQTRAERDQLRQHILDIDAHATPYGDIPDDPGYVGVYLLTAGALHRALGTIGHTAPKCEAEAKLSEARAELARYAERLDRRTAELRDAHNDLLDVRGILSPAGYEPVTPLPLVPTVAPAVQWLVDRLAAVEQDRDRLKAELEQAQPVLTAASNVVKVWRQWRVGRGKEVIPIKALALAVDVHTLAPVAAALTERECPGLPTTPGVLDDGMHCDHWYDGGPCRRCSTAAEPSGTEAGLDPNAPPIEAVLHALGDVIAPDEPTGRTRCPLCKTLPIGHEGDCEP